VEPNTLGEKMGYQILAFIIVGLAVICVGLTEDKGSTSYESLVGGGIGWIICSLLFPAIQLVLLNPIFGG